MGDTRRHKLPVILVLAALAVAFAAPASASFAPIAPAAPVTASSLAASVQTPTPSLGARPSLARTPPGPRPYFGARYYGSKIGRFTTTDPFLDQSAALVDPQRWNRYAYGRNNPLRHIDPDGRDTIDLAIGFGQGIGNVAVGIVTTPIALVTNPSGVASGIAQDFRLLGHGLANPGEVVDTYVQLAVSQNDADQRVLGAAFGQGAATAALVLAPTAKGAPATATIGPKPGSAGGPGAGRRFSDATRDAARAESPNCVFCETPTTRGRGPTQSNIDHSIPKSRGGNNTLANAQNTCRDCNLRKGAKTTEEFLKQ
jgi:RHS repeat-associated protein